MNEINGDGVKDLYLALYSVGLIAMLLFRYGRMARGWSVAVGVVNDTGSTRWLVDRPPGAAASEASDRRLRISVMHLASAPVMFLICRRLRRSKRTPSYRAAEMLSSKH